jgi:hypothetical protein
MTELHDRLDRLAGPAVPATEDQADADLARGRRALRRRRTAAGAASGVFAVAAAAAVIAYGVADRPAAHPAAPSAVAQAPAVASAKLVAYHGDQPQGYTIDKVPAGWEIQGDSNYVLTLAPKNATDKNPDTWIGKIAIMLQSKDQHTWPTGTPVTVDGKKGLITAPEAGSGARSLYVMQPNGVGLIVQIWDAKGWTDDAIVEFGAGVHVLATAQQGVG